MLENNVNYWQYHIGGTVRSSDILCQNQLNSIIAEPSANGFVQTDPSVNP